MSCDAGGAASAAAGMSGAMGAQSAKTAKNSKNSKLAKLAAMQAAMAQQAQQQNQQASQAAKQKDANESSPLKQEQQQQQQPSDFSNNGGGENRDSARAFAPSDKIDASIAAAIGGGNSRSESSGSSSASDSESGSRDLFSGAKDLAQQISVGSAAQAAQIVDAGTLMKVAAERQAAVSGTTGGSRLSTGDAGRDGERTAEERPVSDQIVALGAGSSSRDPFAGFGGTRGIIVPSGMDAKGNRTDGKGGLGSAPGVDEEVSDEDPEGTPHTKKRSDRTNVRGLSLRRRAVIEGSSGTPDQTSFLKRNK